jgi:hypothetical protein
MGSDGSGGSDKRLTWRDAEIRDGFTQLGYVEEEHGYSPSVEFEFRPMIAERMEEVEGKRERLKARGEEAKARQEVCRVLDRMVNWVRFDGGEEQRLDLAGYRRLRISCQSAMYNIIIGLVPSDPRVKGQDLSSESEELEPLQEELGK